MTPDLLEHYLTVVQPVLAKLGTEAMRIALRQNQIFAVEDVAVAGFFLLVAVAAFIFAQCTAWQTMREYVGRGEPGANEEGYKFFKLPRAQHWVGWSVALTLVLLAVPILCYAFGRWYSPEFHALADLLNLMKPPSGS